MAQIIKKEVIEPIELKNTHGDIIATFDEDMINAVKNVICPEITNDELFVFFSVANKWDLDPFAGEIYFAKFENKGQVMSGRDGYRKIAMREPTYKIHYSDYVCKNDTFEITRKMGKLVDIVHKYTHIDRGSLMGAYCVLETTDDRTYFFYAEFKYYNRQKNAWETYPADMIIKVAETRVFKSFANINGIPAEETMPIEYSKEENGASIENKVECINTVVVES